MKEKIHWLNTVRAIAVIAIYFRHSEIYYCMTSDTSVLTDLFTPFRVAVFFFVSGFLFFRKHITSDVGGCLRYGLADWYSSLKHLMFRLAIPTVLFATLIYIPKNLFHQSELNVSSYFYDVFGGVSYWFTSALTIAQIIMLTLLLTRRRSVWVYLLVGGGLAAAGVASASAEHAPFPWYWQSALVGTLFLALGGTYMKYEKQIDQFVKPHGSALLIVAYVAVTLLASPSTMVAPVRIDVIGFVAILLGIASFVAISKMLPSTKLMDYIGGHTITFYFMSGVMPAFVSTVFHKCIPSIHELLIPLIAVLSLMLGFVVTYAINRWAPFMLDFRRLRK